jgi:hypothetical protein
MVLVENEQGAKCIENMNVIHPPSPYPKDYFRKPLGKECIRGMKYFGEEGVNR